jgi:hypothetical protein
MYAGLCVKPGHAGLLMYAGLCVRPGQVPLCMLGCVLDLGRSPYVCWAVC